MIRCLDCTIWSMKGSPKMAPLGFGVCTLEEKHRTFSGTFQRECGKFESAASEVVARRVEWLKEAK